MAERAQIIVKGIVQGVGFRPFVFNLAESLQLKGYVINTSDGVFIDIEGARVPEFVDRLRRDAPPLSQITDLIVNKIPRHGYSTFTIRRSVDHEGPVPFTLISPDISICDNCLKELLDPSNRRYLYPFINCTNCGPRFSITRSVPYDRPNTTMSGFTMCQDCLKEYQDPRNRRFHAQPNGCPACGPVTEFRARGSEFEVKGPNAIQEAIKLLKQGGIVAVKGLGGFHIACDATDDNAVRRLRERKRKSNKPFAVMSPSLEAAREFCLISPEEKQILESKRRPVVLLVKKPDHDLSLAVSPNNRFIGLMLPYTPLHYLLFYHPFDNTEQASPRVPGMMPGLFSEKTLAPNFKALIMTSGNLSEEPIVHDNQEAMRKLSGIADAFLFHDRGIFMRVDDSVMRLRIADWRLQNKKLSVSLSQSAIRNSTSEICFLRRSRGYAPDPIELHEDGPEVLGCGADLKNTFTITKGKFAIPGQHIGDMENYETVKFFEESLANLKSVYRADPKVIVHDLHPGYLSTKWAIECGMRNAECGMKTYGVQHHYAHIGSVMAEHGLKERIIGVAFDGTGYGTDGNLWGGEFMIASLDEFERVAQLQYIALPGAESAIKEPWRTAVSYILSAAGDKAQEYFDNLGFSQKYGRDALANVSTVAGSNELSPFSSGAGRLFDAVSAIIGICDRNTFEGEAAMALESLTTDTVDDEYPFELVSQNAYTVVTFVPAIASLVNDISSAVARQVIATRFHNTVASVIRTVVRDLKHRYGISDVALSGGTFQNLYLLNRTVRHLSSDGMNVYLNQKVPCNDGGISLGQAYLIRERLKKAGI